MAKKDNQPGSSGAIGAGTHLVDETICMERVLAREDVELPREEGQSTAAALLACINDDEAISQVGDVALDGLCAPSRFVHVVLEPLDVRRVVLESRADLVLEVVDDHKIGEKGEDVLYLEQVGRLEEAHSPADEGEEVSERRKKGEDETAHVLMSFFWPTT